MNADIIGFTVEIIGKVMIGFTAIMVHYRFRKEHRIDAAVFRSMRREHIIGILGIIFMIIGYFLQLPGKF